MRRLSLPAGPLEQVVEVERAVAGEHDDGAKGALRELADRRAHPQVDELPVEGQRERHVEAAAGEIQGWEHHPARQRGGSKAQAVRLEGVDPERKMLAVELECPDRDVGDRRRLDERPHLCGMQLLVPALDGALHRAHQRLGGWKSSSEIPSWIRR